jgi:hypothetical protein
VFEAGVFFQRRAKDSLGFCGTLAALVAATDFAAQRAHVVHAAFGYRSPDLGVSDLFTDANVHETARYVEDSRIIGWLRIIINSRSRLR